MSYNHLRFTETVCIKRKDQLNCTVAGAALCFLEIRRE